MKRLRRRLFLHFTLQYISLAVGLMVMFILILLILIIKMTDHEAEFNYYQTKINTIAMDTSDSIDKLEMVPEWDTTFSKEKIWVQVIDHKGTVVEESHVPDGFPHKYNQHELYTMQKENEYNGYSLYFYLETTYDHPYLFVLGHLDDNKKWLKQILHDYGSTGIIPNDQVTEVNKKLAAVDGYLQIIDANDHILQQLGSNKPRNSTALDMAVRNYLPDMYKTKTTILTHPVTNDLWILHTPNANKKEIKLSSLQDIMIAFAISVVIVLLIAIGISVWNGFRYGNPLFIFTSWLSRMGNGQYEDVLTEKEKKLVFRKNGKLRLKYRLYTEVFQAFYEMAEKLDATKKEREKLERSREEWMTGISHDLRTPLSSMQGYGALLESDQYEWSREELVEIGRTIDEKSKYMLHLIEDFSLHFQLKNQTLQTNKVETDINGLIEEVIEKFQQDRTLIDYTFTLNPLAAPVMLAVARRWFERMLDNLIYNAVKHNPPGTKIAIHLAVDNHTLKMLVQDNGVGMDEDTVANMFNRYYRGTSTEERSEGSGLGMSIALDIAEFHQGSISVRSEVGVGTTVELTFPMIE